MYIKTVELSKYLLRNEGREEGVSITFYLNIYCEMRADRGTFL